MVNRVALRRFFPKFFGFPCQFSFRRRLHTYLSSGAGTVGQIEADVPCGLSLTPPHPNYRKLFILLCRRTYSRPQWSRCLRHELSSFARKLGSWVRIPLKAWMFGVCMRLFCVCVVLCLGSGLAMGWSLVQGVLPSVKKWLRNWIRGQGPEWGGTVI
jgi:hypothetical protein